MVCFSPLRGLFLTCVWSVSHLCVVCFSPVCGLFLTSAWSVSHLCVVCFSPVCGPFLAVICGPGKYFFELAKPTAAPAVPNYDALCKQWLTKERQRFSDIRCVISSEVPLVRCSRRFTQKTKITAIVTTSGCVL